MLRLVQTANSTEPQALQSAPRSTAVKMEDNISGTLLATTAAAASVADITSTILLSADDPLMTHSNAVDDPREPALDAVRRVSKEGESHADAPTSSQPPV